ncbi:MAG: hypothetical protein HKO71_07780, partial [Pseudomonadales bacterium]|nr:hypothetical protein [Pseudomonadales bacterium]
MSKLVSSNLKAIEAQQRSYTLDMPTTSSPTTAKAGAINAADLAALAENAGRAAELMRLMSNQNRLMILCSLIDGELSVGELND